MTDLPCPWGAYARLQVELSRKSQVDDRAWGYEAGMNLILASDSAVNQPSQGNIDRAVASGARRDRYRAELRALYLQDEESVNPNADLQAIEARQILQLIKNSVANSDWGLLCDVAVGHGYAEIVSWQEGATAVGLRARVLRLRRSLMPLVHSAAARSATSGRCSQTALATALAAAQAAAPCRLHAARRDRLRRGASA